MTREFAFSLGAAFLYAFGAVFMKSSDGLRNALPAAALYACFAAGATLQALALRHMDIGTGNTVVLGVEAIAALLLGIAIFHEAVTPTRLLAVAMVATGVWLLRN